MKIFKNNTKDSDADGLSNQQEKYLGTDPLNSDTDKDGVGDFQEVNIYETDPLDSDTDKDGTNDGDEIKKGQNPLGPGLLKDLFIPHEGNNYRPKALEPKRIFFYGITTIFMKIIVIVFTISLPLTAWLTPNLMMEQAKKIIILTNEVRINLGVKALSENDLLYESSYNKAQDMLINQYFAHRNSRGDKVADWLKNVNYNYQVAGENLAMGFSSAEKVVKAWQKSETHYKNMIDPDFTEIGVGVVSGPYKDKETTLVAQHFGNRRKNIIEDNIIENEDIVDESEDKVEINIENENKLSETQKPKNTELDDNKEVKKIEKVLSEKTNKKESEIEIITIEEENDDILIQAKAYLDKDTNSAEAIIKNQKINLTLSSEGEEMDIWVGNEIISKENKKEILNPLIPANIKTIKTSGEKTTEDITWKNIEPVKISNLDQYLFLKTNSSKYTNKLFSLNKIFYQALLMITCLTFLLNIFIKLKKQNFKIIISSAGLISLLILLILI